MTFNRGTNFISLTIFFIILNIFGINILKVASIKEEATSVNQIPTNITSTEKEALEKFRAIVKDALYRNWMHEDYYLLQFLRHKDLNVGNAAESIRQAHKWRIENKIDGILQEDMTKLLKLFPYYSDGIEFEGRPVISWDFGRWDIRRIAVAGDMPKLTRYTDRILEEATTLVRQKRSKLKKDITQYSMILDGYGFSTRTHACISCLPFYYSFITHTDSYYPRTGHKVYFLNVPRVFNSLLTLIRPIMSPFIRDSVKIFGFDSKEWKNEFSKIMAINELRKQFGGTKENNSII